MTSKAVFVLSLIIALIAPSAHSTTEAATFTCDGDSEGPYPLSIHEIEDVRALGLPLDRQFCSTLNMSGPIVPSDVKSFKDWLRHEPYTHYVKLASPGGSIEAAMEIGRLIRARFMKVWSYYLDPEEARSCSKRKVVEDLRKRQLPIDDASIKERQTHCRRRHDCRFENRCCLSACVFILVGSADRIAGNIGLHRPTLSDFSQRSYEDARQTLSRGRLLIEQYLKEMEISQSVLEAMMQVPPDEIRLLDYLAAPALIAGLTADRKLIEEKYYKRDDFQMAPSVYDWLKAKCVKKGSGDYYSGLGLCLGGELEKEQMRRAKRLNP